MPKISTRSYVCYIRSRAFFSLLFSLFIVASVFGSFLTFYDEIISGLLSHENWVEKEENKNYERIQPAEDMKECVFNFIALFGSFTYQQTNKNENHWHSSVSAIPIATSS